MIEIIEPYGFCFGVKNSISLVLQAKKKHPRSKIFFLKPLVHNASTNKQVLKKLHSEVYDPEKPISFYQDAYFALPAHGYTIKDLRLVKSLRSDYINCTCPILIVNKNTIKGNVRSGFTVFLLGKTNHPEILSILDEIKGVKFIPIEKLDTFDFSTFENFPKLAIYPQSTLGESDWNSFLDKAQPHIKGKFIKGSICKECLKRWEKVKKINPLMKATFIVVGDKDSSNANEFKKVCQETHLASTCILLENKQELKKEVSSIDFKKNIYLVSSTSASKESFEEIYKYLKHSYLIYKFKHPSTWINKKN